MCFKYKALTKPEDQEGKLQYSRVICKDKKEEILISKNKNKSIGKIYVYTVTVNIISKSDLVRHVFPKYPAIKCLSTEQCFPFLTTAHTFSFIFFSFSNQSQITYLYL